jgi:hypothetical protein
MDIRVFILINGQEVIAQCERDENGKMRWDYPMLVFNEVDRKENKLYTKVSLLGNYANEDIFNQINMNLVLNPLGYVPNTGTIKLYKDTIQNIKAARANIVIPDSKNN